MRISLLDLEANRVMTLCGVYYKNKHSDNTEFFVQWREYCRLFCLDCRIILKPNLEEVAISVGKDITHVATVMLSVTAKTDYLQEGTTLHFLSILELWNFLEICMAASIDWK